MKGPSCIRKKNDQKNQNQGYRRLRAAENTVRQDESRTELAECGNLPHLGFLSLKDISKTDSQMLCNCPVKGHHPCDTGLGVFPLVHYSREA